MASDTIIGFLKLFGRDVTIILRGKECLLRAKLPMVGTKEGPLARAQRDSLRKAFDVADAEGAA